MSPSTSLPRKTKRPVRPSAEPGSIIPTISGVETKSFHSRVQPSSAKEFAMRTRLALTHCQANDYAANVVTTNLSQYQPISCEFHDLLEVHATTRKPVQMQIRDDNGVVKLCNASITDIYARNGAEYLSMSTGETVRLDKLIEVDGAKLANYC
jgi:Rho-binding antiterminator